MKYDPDLHHRRSIRLSNHDYHRPGAYFITLVTHGRERLFGEIVNGDMSLNALGGIVEEEWRRTGRVRREIEIDAFVVMPNHAHMIVLVGAHGRAPLHAPPPEHPPEPFRAPRSLGSLVAGFKSVVTKRINEACDTPRAPVWQRNYYEHVIRDETELAHIRQYILDNPPRWKEDPENVSPL